MTGRDWPGLPTDQPHGTAWENDHTGDPFRWCESCGGVHHPNNQGCNGLRDAEDERCDAILGESRCQRQRDHLGEHKVRSQLLRIDWEMLSTEVES